MGVISHKPTQNLDSIKQTVFFGTHAGAICWKSCWCNWNPNAITKSHIHFGKEFILIDTVNVIT